MKITDLQILLASKSPRRRDLLTQLGLNYSLAPDLDVDESFPSDILPIEVASYLANKKATAYASLLENNNQVLITADTIVIIDDEVIGKPTDNEDARQMLRKLSGRKHLVITGVCLSSLNKKHIFESLTEVYFKELTNQEIEYYVETFTPLDKAGAYGIQEWIGYIGITRIEGSYFNVMGLPVQALYDALQKF